jgi:hypothetical protein
MKKSAGDQGHDDGLLCLAAEIGKAGEHLVMECLIGGVAFSRIVRLI